MAEDGGGRKSERNPVNAAHLKAAQKKYPTFEGEATVEFKRLYAMRSKLLGASKEHAMYHHLRTIREGWMRFNS
jgi:hypothetical protein